MHGQFLKQRLIGDALTFYCVFDRKDVIILRMQSSVFSENFSVQFLKLKIPDNYTVNPLLSDPKSEFVADFFAENPSLIQPSIF